MEPSELLYSLPRLHYNEPVTNSPRQFLFRDYDHEVSEMLDDITFRDACIIFESSYMGRKGTGKSIENLFDKHAVPFVFLKQTDIKHDVYGSWKVTLLKKQSNDKLIVLVEGISSLRNVTAVPLHQFGFKTPVITEFLDQCKIWESDYNKKISYGLGHSAGGPFLAAATHDKDLSMVGLTYNAQNPQNSRRLINLSSRSDPLTNAPYISDRANSFTVSGAEGHAVKGLFAPSVLRLTWQDVLPGYFPSVPQLPKSVSLQYENSFQRSSGSMLYDYKSRVYDYKKELRNPSLSNSISLISPAPSSDNLLQMPHDLQSLDPKTSDYLSAERKEKESYSGTTIDSDRGFANASGTRERPKPKPIDWENAGFIFGVTPEGYIRAGVGAPVSLGGPGGTNASVEVQIDPKALLNVGKAIFNIKIDEKKKEVKTSLGTYKIEWYKMGHSITSGENDYKVEIKDTDGKTHTTWVPEHSFNKRINLYLSEIHNKKMNQEISKFSNNFNQNINNRNVPEAQKILNSFFGLHTNLPSSMKQPYQLTINEAQVRERVRNLQGASIATIALTLNASTQSGFVSRAQFIEQELLRDLLIKELRNSGTAEDFQNCQSLTQVNRGEYVEIPNLIRPEFPSQDDFRGHNKHYSNEMRDRALASVNRILDAYSTLENTVREGLNPKVVLDNLKNIFNKEKDGGFEGFGIRLHKGRNLGWLFETNYPEIVKCVNGTSQWLKEYNVKSSPNNASPLITSNELRFAEIYKNLQDCLQAASSINVILDKYSEQSKDGNKIIKIHQITDEERYKMRSLAEMISKNSQKESELYKFAQNALSFNYQILSDSYGKYAGLFLMNAFSDYAQGLEKKSHKILAQSFTMLHTVCPSLLQDLSILPLAYMQGHSAVALNNLRSNVLKGLPSNLTEASFASIKVAKAALPLILDPQDKKNRGIYQNLSVASSIVSAAQDLQNETVMLSYLPTAPFEIYEFLASEPESPPVGEATWIDEVKYLLYYTVTSFIPKSFQIRPGNLPENVAYYAFKQMATNFSIGSSAISATRKITGTHGSGRDIKAAAVFGAALIPIQYYVGKFDEQCCSAMVSNANYHLKNSDYEKVLPSIISLQKQLEQNFRHREHELRFIRLKCFILETRSNCYYNLTVKSYKEGKSNEARYYLQKAMNVFEKDKPLALKRLDEILSSETCRDKHLVVAKTKMELNKIEELAKIFTKRLLRQE